MRILLILMMAFTLAAAPADKKGAPAKKAGTAAADVKSAKGSAALLDINSASEQQLKELPGIGDSYAAKIIQNRPYRAKNELVQKNIVPQATYDKIKEKIIARQSK